MTERIMLLGLIFAILFMSFLERTDYKATIDRAEDRIKHLTSQHESAMIHVWYLENEVQAWLKERWKKGHSGNPKEEPKKKASGG